MVSAQTFLAVFTLVSLSPIYTAASTSTFSSARSPTSENLYEPTSYRSGAQLEGGWTARPRRYHRKRGYSERPLIVHGGVDLPIHQRSCSSSRPHKRSLDNGTIVDLASAHNTYVVPVTIGSPAIGYPLQLDLGSSDLLLVSSSCPSSSSSSSIKCPESLGERINPYYDVDRYSKTFLSVNNNLTAFDLRFADGRVVSGFVARENVTLGQSEIAGQVFGMVNSTNLTLAEQQISGILGLGFPRLSVLAQALFRDDSVEGSLTSTKSSGSSVISSSSSTSSSSSSLPRSSGSPYLPPLLESLVSTPHIPYPVFALALAPPPDDATSTSTSSSSSSSPSSRPRFDSSIGSLTLGGVSSLYVSSEAGSGWTVDDIEWHEVVPFGKAYTVNNGTANAQTLSNSTSASSPASASTSSSSFAYISATQIGPQPTSILQKRQDGSTATTVSSQTSPRAVPTSAAELASEEYLQWAIQLRNVTINGTDINLQSTYHDLDIPPVALLDVGFNGIAGPIDQVAKIFANIPTARQVSIGQWIAPCDTQMTLGFSFGGRYVQLQPSEWLYASVDSSTFCLAWPVGTTPASDGIDWQLGTPFLKKVYSVFSYGINGVQAPLVGFLPLTSVSERAHSASSSASSVGSSVSSTSRSISSSSANTTIDAYGPTPATVIPYSPTLTVATVLPNNLIPVPSYSTPSYIYALDSSLTMGVMQTLGLANPSKYSVTAVPIISPLNTSIGTTSTTEVVGGVGDMGGQAYTPSSTSGGARAWERGRGIIGCSTILSISAVLVVVFAI